MRRWRLWPPVSVAPWVCICVPLRQQVAGASTRPQPGRASHLRGSRWPGLCGWRPPPECPRPMLWWARPMRFVVPNNKGSRWQRRPCSHCAAPRAGLPACVHPHHGRADRAGSRSAGARQPVTQRCTKLANGPVRHSATTQGSEMRCGWASWRRSSCDRSTVEGDQLGLVVHHYGVFAGRRQAGP